MTRQAQSWIAPRVALVVVQLVAGTRLAAAQLAEPAAMRSRVRIDFISSRHSRLRHGVTAP